MKQNAQEFGDRKRCGRLPAQDQTVTASSQIQIENSSSVSFTPNVVSFLHMEVCTDIHLNGQLTFQEWPAGSWAEAKNATFLEKY